MLEVLKMHLNILFINTMEIRCDYFTTIRNTWTVFIPRVHITDLSPGITIGNMDTTGLRWLSSFFNTPADEKDKCDEHHALINWSQSDCLSVLEEFRVIMNGQVHPWYFSQLSLSSPRWLGHVNDSNHHQFKLLRLF